MSSTPQTVPSDSRSYNLERAISCHTRPSTTGAEGWIEDAYHKRGLGLCRIFERGIGSAASQKRGHFCRDVRPGEVSAGVIGGQLAAQAGFPILVSCKRNHFRKAGTAHLWVWTESARFKTDAPTIRNDTEAFKCLCGSGLPPSGLFLRPLRRFFVSSCTLNGCDAGTSNLD